jgi:HK97 family phage prohead protease
MTALLTRTAGTVGLRNASELGLAATAGTVEAGMPFVAGRFSVYDQWTQISNSREGRFIEKIGRGAFTRTINEDRAAMRLLFEHGQDPFVGTRPIAPIDGLGEDATGVWYFGRLFDTVAARELRPLLEARPPVLGSSFRFSVDREKVDDRPARSDRNPNGCPSGPSSRRPCTSLGRSCFRPTPARRRARRPAATRRGRRRRPSGR